MSTLDQKAGGEKLEGKENPKKQLIKEVYAFVDGLERDLDQPGEAHEGFIEFFDNERLRQIINTTNELSEKAEDVFGKESSLHYVLIRLRDDADFILKMKNKTWGGHRFDELNDEQRENVIEEKIVDFSDKISIISEMRKATEESEK